MKKRYMLSALLAMLAVTGYGQAKKYQVVGVGFYNCENFFDPTNDPKKEDDDFTPEGSYHYTQDIYKQKLHNLATVFEQLGTDNTPDGAAIIGMAEVEDSTVLKDLAQQPEIRMRGYRYVWFYGPDERGINTAMFYNPKYFKLLAAESIPVDLSSIDKRPTRNILHAYGVLAGDTVHVLVNHWPSRLGGEAASAPKRAIAAATDKRIVDSIMHANPGSKVLLMGDLNDDPTSPSVAKVLGAKEERAAVKSNELYNPWAAYFEKGIGTLAFNDSWNLFDQIMVSGTLLKSEDKGWHYYKSEIFNKDFLVQKYGKYKGYPHRSFNGTNWANGYSDHFPVIIYLVRAI